MQTKILGSFFAFIFGLMLLSSCAKDTLVNEPSNINPDQPVSFSTQIQPIFTGSCIGCHGGTFAPDLREGKAYADLMATNCIDTLNPTNSLLYKVMAPGGSMANYCTKDQADLTLVWIQQGAKNN